jgi:hypothetical protein
MRLPRFRLRTLLVLVAVSALAMGLVSEERRYREWARYDREERNVRRSAESWAAMAALHSNPGDPLYSKGTAEQARMQREDADRSALMKRRYERPWYRFLAASRAMRGGPGSCSGRCYWSWRPWPYHSAEASNSPGRHWHSRCE